MARSPALQEADVLPEADRLEGFPHPRETRRIFGHTAVEQTLAEVVASQRLHHGWLLAGPEGIGKATLAYRFAAYALARPAERSLAPSGLDLPEQSSALRMVRALSHPGLMVIRRPYDAKAKRFAATIPIDEVRRLRSFLAHTAGGAAERDAPVQRVVIVDQADELNASSANALLKSLEEPPPRTIFLLVTSQPGRLLPTIRSRCRTLVLSPLGAGDLRAAAEQAIEAAGLDAPGASEWEQLVHLARGSVRRLLSLATSDGLKLAQRAYAIMERLPDIDWNSAHVLAEELSGNAAEQKFETFFDLLLDLAARLARAAATGEGEQRERALAARVIPDGRLAAWADLWEAVTQRKAEVMALNLDRKALILDTLAQIQAVARR